MKKNEEIADNAEEKDKKDSNWKSSFSVWLTIIVLGILLFNFLPDALEKADHSPTSVIEQSHDGEYVNEFLERFE